MRSSRVPAVLRGVTSVALPFGDLAFGDLASALWNAYFFRVANLVASLFGSGGVGTRLEEERVCIVAYIREHAAQSLY